MNKETIDYTSEEFWATAPSDATHWEPESEDWRGSWIKICPEGVFYSGSDEWNTEFRQDECDCDYEELFETFIPRPTTFTKAVQESPVSTTDWFVDNQIVGVPEVGEMVEAFDPLNEDWHVVKVLDSQEHRTIAVRDSKDKLWWTYKFRPIKKEPTIQEKILEAWKAQGIDFAYDNEDTNFSFKVLVDFVVNNFDVKEKE